MPDPKPDAKIGELNGPWAMLFRIVLVFVPIFLAATLGLNVWFVQTIHGIQLEQAEMRSELTYFMGVGQRFTQADGAALDALLRTEILKARREIIDEVSRDYPPTWLRDQVANTAERLERLDDRLARLEARE